MLHCDSTALVIAQRCRSHQIAIDPRRHHLHSAPPDCQYISKAGSAWIHVRCRSRAMRAVACIQACLEVEPADLQLREGTPHVVSIHDRQPKASSNHQRLQAVATANLTAQHAPQLALLRVCRPTTPCSGQLAQHMQIPITARTACVHLTSPLHPD